MGKSSYTVLALRDELSASLSDGDFLILKLMPLNLPPPLDKADA